MTSKWCSAATCLASFHYQQEALYGDRHLPPFSEVEQSPIISPETTASTGGENLNEFEDDDDYDDGGSVNDNRSLNGSVQRSLATMKSKDGSLRSVAGGNPVQGRSDSSGPFLLHRWLKSAQGRHTRRRERNKKNSLSGGGKTEESQRQQQEIADSTTDTSTPNIISLVMVPSDTNSAQPPPQSELDVQDSDQDNTDTSISSTQPTSKTRPTRKAALEAVLEELPSMVDAESPSLTLKRSNKSSQQARPQTLPLMHLFEPPQQQRGPEPSKDGNDTKEKINHKHLHRKNSVDDLDARNSKHQQQQKQHQKPESPTKNKPSRKNPMIERHNPNPQYESLYGGNSMRTTISDSSSKNSDPATRAPQVHRRVPSADVPQPWEIVHSFQNRPKLDQHQNRRVGYPQSGVHRRSTLVAGTLSSTRGENRTSISEGPNRSNADARRRIHRGSAAPVTSKGVGLTPVHDVGGSLGKLDLHPAAGLMLTDFENEVVQKQRQRDTTQMPDTASSDDGGIYDHQLERHRSTIPPPRNDAHMSQIDAAAMESIVSSLNGPRILIGGPTIDTRCGRTSPSTIGGDPEGDGNYQNDFFTDEDNNPIADAPSLFLQEAAHLLSLTSAVAMASLRADMEGVTSPLVEYIPGLPFPPVNPDEIQNTSLLILDEDSLADERVDAESVAVGSAKTKKESRIQIQPHFISSNGFWRAVYFLLGLSRSPRQRTLYNATRPFTVLGGISDREVEMLQQARGPEAQMALCGLWFKEFISREYLSGSTGAVAPPIITRVYQFFSDGMTQYNQCRKIAYIQFPFPQAQLTIFFLFISLTMFPYLYYSYVSSPLMACILNFFTVMCFVGQQEVARELQDPFYQYPNDLPLNRYQAEFNEALISTLFTGFHPDLTNHEVEETLTTSTMISERTAKPISQSIKPTLPNR
jgi:hypothetical protein